MTNIDFVPNDYIQKRDSTRFNIIYMVLFVIVMAGIASTFSVIKMRQQAMNKRLEIIDVELETAQEKFALLEQYEARGREMINTASIATNLYENVNRSVILACLTNNLPDGVSLTELKLYEKVNQEKTKAATQYQLASGASSPATQEKVQVIDTSIEIKGIAPSDIEVAAYISKLAGSFLLENIALVESKEIEIEDGKFREYKLTSMLKSDLEINSENIESLKERAAIAMQLLP